MDIENTFSWSKSRASMFDSCRYQYYLHYYAYWGGWEFEAPPRKQRLYVLRRMSSIAQWAGIAVHELAALYLKIWRGGTEPDLEALISQAREGMRQDYRNSKTGGYWRVPKSFGLIEHEYDDAIPAERFKENWEAVELCLRNFASSPILADIKASDPDRYRSIDTLDSFQIDGVPIWAAPDFAYERPNGRLIIVDWKTGAARPEDDFQLAGYAAYAEQRWGYPPSWVLGALVYLKTGEVRRVPVERSVVDDFQAKARVSIGEMRSVLTDVEGNEAREADFARTEHVGRCYGCPFRIECWPAGRVVDGGRPSAQSLSSS